MATYLFLNASRVTQSYEERRNLDEISAFNQKFLSFAKDINAQDMVSLINLLQEYNEKYRFVSDKQVKLFINNRQINANSVTNTWKMAMMQGENVEEDFSFQYKNISYKENSGYIDALYFTSSKPLP